MRKSASLIKWSRSPETYGERRIRLWLSGEHGEFTRGELREMHEAYAWERAHPDVVTALDWWVGRRVMLRESHPTFATDVVVGEAARVPLSVPGGASFIVVVRTRERLLARSLDNGFTYLLRPEWLSVRAPRRISL